MDLNQLLFQHQIALMRREGSHGGVPFGSRFDMISHYERRIARLRNDMGTSQYPAWMTASSPASLARTNP